MNLFTRCGICWENECKHWSKSFTSTKSVLRGILFDDIKYTDILILKCEKCDSTKEFKDVYDISFINCKCNNRICVSKNKIEDNQMQEFEQSDQDNKCPTKFCKECNGSKKILYKQLKKCVKCDGMGGLTCTKCNCLGFSLYNISNETNTEYDIKTVMLEKCKCDNGYEYRCTYCDGKKAIAILDEMIECNNCY